MGESKGYITNADERGSINISEDVIAAIAAAAASDTEGVHGLFSSHGRDIVQKLGRKTMARGVRIVTEEDNVKIDIYIMASIGYAVNEVGATIQQAVKRAVLDATGLVVSAVNVHVCGISMKKEKPN